MTDQLLLKFPSKQAYLKEDFYVSSSNNEAFKLIESWPKWIKKTVNIFGPQGSGKTHLISMLKNKTSTIDVDSNQVTDQIFFEYKLKEVLIIENLKENISENLLYTLYNVAQQDNKYFVLTSREPINKFNFKSMDLKSRVNSTTIIGIDLPSDELISVILSKSFSDKQIKVEKKHIDYVIKRIDRSYEKISQFILILDKYSLKKKKSFWLKID